ncbi:MAG: Hsp20 family protein [Noviherbaspirillum sp.]
MATLEHSIDVNVTPETAFALWMHVEDYPRFMDGVREVRRVDETRLHWRALRHEHEVEWDSEFTELIANQLIRWRDLGGQYHGSLVFEPLGPGQTRIRMTMEFDALPVDKQQALTLRVAGDLERFKRIAEQGASAHASASAEASGDGANAGTRGPQAWLRSQFASWDDPIGLVRKVSDEVDQLFARFVGRPSAAKSGEGGAAGKWMPPVEILQRGDRLVICVDLPGISRDSVDVEIQRDRIIVEGERKEEPRPADVPGFRRSERSYGPFHRTVPLPEGVDPDSAEAAMRDGVLEISLRMPTPAERRGKRLDIHS